MRISLLAAELNCWSPSAVRGFAMCRSGISSNPRIDLDQGIPSFAAAPFTPRWRSMMTGLRSAVEGIAVRWRDHRNAMAAIREFANLDPAIAGEIAAEAGVSVRDLGEVVARGSGADRLMQRMIAAFGIGDEITASASGVLRDTAVLCSRCRAKRRCRDELDAGTARNNAHLFCPNAPTFESLT